MNDEELREAFGVLRRSEAARAPRFERLWRRVPAVPRRRRPLALAFVAMILLTILAVSVWYRPRQIPQPTITAWRAPTDFLLDTPGRRLLDSLPDLKGKTQ